MRNCGECLMNDVVVTELLTTGLCPRCGADYGPEQPRTMRDVIAHQWYRVDKSTGKLLAVNAKEVLKYAMKAFRNPTAAAAAIKTAGRFQTDFAIYSRGDKLTPSERTV
jgi:protein-disulfide isomerase-like protein with CxxC motif